MMSALKIINLLSLALLGGFAQVPEYQQVYVTRTGNLANIQLQVLQVEGIERRSDGDYVLWLMDRDGDGRTYVLYTSEWPPLDARSMIYVERSFLSLKDIGHTEDIDNTDETSTDESFRAVAPMELWVSKIDAENYLESVRRALLE